MQWCVCDLYLQEIRFHTCIFVFVFYFYNTRWIWCLHHCVLHQRYLGIVHRWDCRRGDRFRFLRNHAHFIIITYRRWCSASGEMTVFESSFETKLKQIPFRVGSWEAMKLEISSWYRYLHSALWIIFHRSTDHLAMLRLSLVSMLLVLRPLLTYHIDIFGRE